MWPVTVWQTLSENFAVANASGLNTDQVLLIDQVLPGPGAYVLRIAAADGAVATQRLADAGRLTVTR